LEHRSLLSALAPAIPCQYSNTTAGQHPTISESQHQLQYQLAKDCLLPQGSPCV